MGAGGKEVSLDVFETHLKKLLHIIDKLPKVEREKAVLILRNSANHYSNLTSGHPLPPPAPCPPLIFSSIQLCNQALSEIPVSQVTKTFDLLKDESLAKGQLQADLGIIDNQINTLKDTQTTTIQPNIIHPDPIDVVDGGPDDFVPGSQDELLTQDGLIHDKSESQAILEELGGLGDDPGAGDGFMDEAEDWDQHILELEDEGRLHPVQENQQQTEYIGVERLDVVPTMEVDQRDDPIMEHVGTEDRQLGVETGELEGNNAPSLEGGLAQNEKQPQGLTGIEQTDDIHRDDPIDCSLCSKRLSVVSSSCPVSCRECRTPLCNFSCFQLHSQQCRKTEEAKQGVKPSVKKKQEFKCEVCDKFFLTGCTLKRHLEGHKNNDCDKCSLKFATRRALVAHMKSVHFVQVAEKYYPCKFCSRRFTKKPSLWFHYTSHVKGNQVVCLKCGVILESKEELDKHTLHHRITQFSCDRCGDFFLRKQTYNMHIKTHDNYSCPLCTKAFSSIKRLKLHKRKDHGPKATKSTPNEISPFDTVKSENANLEGERTVHPVIIKDTKKSFKCGFCNFENLNYKKVLRHERRHKSFRKFVCELCGNAYNTEYNLREHTLYVHSNERNYKCSKCEKSFKAKNALIRHEQVHNERRSYSCHCGKSYKRQSHLNRHFAATSHGYTPSMAPAPVPMNPISSGVEDKLGPPPLEGSTWLPDPGVEKKVPEQERVGMKLGIKSTESLTGFPAVSQPLNSIQKSIAKDSRRTQLTDKLDDYEKLKHYKIPKKFTSPQKYPFYSDKAGSSRMNYTEFCPVQDPCRGDPNRTAGHIQSISNKYQYENHPVKPLYPPQHSNQRHFLEPEDRAMSERGGLAGFQDKYHNNDYLSTRLAADIDRGDFLDRYPANPDKIDYSSITDKQYQDFDDKSYVIPEVLDDRQSEKSFLPLDDRFFQTNLRGDNSNYSTTLDSRFLSQVSTDEFRSDYVIPDAGPADLTITSKDVSNSKAETRSSDYFPAVHPSHSRHSFNKPSRPPSPHSSATSTRSYSEASNRTHFMSPRSQADLYRSSDLFRNSHADNRLQASNQLEGIDENYRPIQDTGYSRQQNHYYDQLDPYVLLSRTAEIEDNFDKRHKYYRQDRYARPEDQNHGGARQDGGLLPPLLALTPSLPPSHTANQSPPNMKLDYICSPNDQISSQYLPDGTLDYY